MRDFLKHIFRFAVFILIQVYVLNKIPHLYRFITPYLYYLPLLWLPFSVSRIWLLVIGFITGLTLDYFMMTPGLHAAACVLIAFVRPYIINIITPKATPEFNYREPSPQAIRWAPYTFYVFVLTLLHHGYMVFLEWLDFGRFLDFIIQVIATTGISMLLIFTVELLFPRKLKFRTNIS